MLVQAFEEEIKFANLDERNDDDARKSRSWYPKNRVLLVNGSQVSC